MSGEVRPIAMGVGGIKFGTVGDGVPGADLKDYPLPTKGSVAFNFADPKEVKIEVEGSEEPFYVELVKDTTDYVEFSIPTPSNEVLKELAGGEVDTTGGKNIWKKPLSTPSISKTFQCETLPKDGKKVVYTIVNGKIASKISQAPGSEQAELLLVRVYMQAAVTADGKRQTAFMREVVTIAGGGEAPANAANVEGGEAAQSGAKK